MLNIVALMGRLTSDPELRQTPSGVSVTTITLAVDRAYSKLDEERQADFIPVICWRNTADFVCKYFQKGSLIAVDGSIQTRTYQDKDGNNRKAFEVVAQHVHFAGHNKSTDSTPAAYTTTPAVAPSAPKHGASYFNAPAKTEVKPFAQVAIGDNADFMPVEEDEDLPF